MKVPFIIYLDFESFLVKNGESDDYHKPSGFSCLTVSSFKKFNNEKPYTYSGPDVMEMFFAHLAILPTNE